MDYLLKIANGITTENDSYKTTPEIYTINPKNGNLVTCIDNKIIGIDIEYNSVQQVVGEEVYGLIDKILFSKNGDYFLIINKLKNIINVFDTKTGCFKISVNGTYCIMNGTYLYSVLNNTLYSLIDNQIYNLHYEDISNIHHLEYKNINLTHNGYFSYEIRDIRLDDYDDEDMTHILHICKINEITPRISIPFRTNISYIFSNGYFYLYENKYLIIIDYHTGERINVIQLNKEYDFIQSVNNNTIVLVSNLNPFQRVFDFIDLSTHNIWESIYIKNTNEYELIVLNNGNVVMHIWDWKSSIYTKNTYYTHSNITLAQNAIVKIIIQKKTNKNIRI